MGDVRPNTLRRVIAKSHMGDAVEIYMYVYVK